MFNAFLQRPKARIRDETVDGPWNKRIKTHPGGEGNCPPPPTWPNTASFATATPSGAVMHHTAECAILAAQAKSAPMRSVPGFFQRTRADLAFIRLDRRGACNSLAICCLLAATAMAGACAGQSLPLQEISFTQGKEPQPMLEDKTTEPARQTVSITGVRVTQGNALDCPQLRDDQGVIHTVSYLSPAVQIGARVAVSGFYGITTHCRGKTLVVRDERIPGD